MEVPPLPSIPIVVFVRQTPLTLPSRICFALLLTGIYVSLHCGAPLMAPTQLELTVRPDDEVLDERVHCDVWPLAREHARQGDIGCGGEPQGLAGAA